MVTFSVLTLAVSSEVWPRSICLAGDRFGLLSRFVGLIRLREPEAFMAGVTEIKRLAVVESEYPGGQLRRLLARRW